MTEDRDARSANPAQPTDALAPLAELADSARAVARDGQGRFLTGNSGGGRPKGARNRLSNCFLSALVDDFASNGIETIARVRIADPVAYLKLIAAIIPRELILQREQERHVEYAELTFEEVTTLAEEERKRKLFRRVIEG